MENFDLVQRAYDELVNSHDIYPTNLQDQIENQKAYLTRRAAYYLNLVDNNIGLLSKTTGNNVMGLSTDIVIKHNGDYYDIATDSAGLVRPVNSDIVSDPSLASRWIQPTKEMAGLTSPIPTPIPIPTPVPLFSDYQVIINKLDALQSNQSELVTNIFNLVHFNQAEIMNKLNEIANRPVTVIFPDYKSSGWLTITLHPVGK